jgi:hypothetical protein
MESAHARTRHSGRNSTPWGPPFEDFTDATSNCGAGDCAVHLLRWQQDPEFDKAFRKARRAAYGQTTARLHQASNAAVSAILKVMVDSSAPASTRLRAADIVLAHTAKAIEIEDVEVRVTELERAAEAAKSSRN